MKKDHITVSQALSLIDKEKFDSRLKVSFDRKKVNPQDALKLGRHGVDVPEDLIEYDDTQLDFSDIPEITDKDMSSGKIRWTVHAEIPLEKEIQDWIKSENIDFNHFVSKLIRNFYDSVKSLPKKTAL